VSHGTEQNALFTIRRSKQKRPLIEDQITAVGLPDPEPEFMFAKAIGRKWRFDYAWPAHKVAFEIEGGTFVGGRHSHGAGFQSDTEKYNRAAILGWCVVRATYRQIKDLAAIRDLVDAFKSRGVEAPNEQEISRWR
jgi:hypothetical protein